MSAFTASRSHQSRRHKNAPLYLEALEARTLLSATLFVTSPLTPQDASHFQTLQSALAVAVPGDTIILQSGFSAGTFNSTTLIAPANAGDNTIHTAASLQVGQVVTIGTTNFSDPAERALVTAVTQNAANDFTVTLANPLDFSHLNSPVDATNASTLGKTIAIDKAITLTADAGVVLPFNLDVWKNTSGATLSNLNLTSFPATSLFLESGAHDNTLTNINAANQVVLTDASNNSFTNITVGNRLFLDAGSSNNLVTSSNLKQLTLRPGSHHNTFTHSTIGSLTATTNSSTLSGNDTFLQNTFTGPVNVTGNLAGPTNDLFSANSFNASNGDALVLLNADGTTLTGNTFSVARDFARAITIADSTHVTISANNVTMTGMSGIAILAYADLADTSLTITANTLTTNDGTAIAFGKYDPSVNLEARVQENDLCNNAVGVSAWGDGNSAGNIDLGGGSTAFGTSIGDNDFTAFTTADNSHYAIGLFNTSSGDTLLANNNKFAAQDPMTVVADSAHNLPALGTGIVLATAALPEVPRQLTVSAPAMSVEKGATLTGPIATFTDNLPGTTVASYTVTITWSDGQTSAASLTKNADGSYSINTARKFSSMGDLTATISISTTDDAAPVTTTFTQDWSITTRNGKVPPGKKK
jgi:hypothetical protein